jgi:hypothetical protein
MRSYYSQVRKPAQRGKVNCGYIQTPHPSLPGSYPRHCELFFFGFLVLLGFELRASQERGGKGGGRKGGKKRERERKRERGERERETLAMSLQAGLKLEIFLSQLPECWDTLDI